MYHTNLQAVQRSVLELVSLQIGVGIFSHHIMYICKHVVL